MTTKKTYSIICWTALPCPWWSRKEEFDICEKRCGITAPSIEEDSPCVSRVTYRTNFKSIMTILKIWGMVWYDHVEVVTNVAKEEQHG